MALDGKAFRDLRPLIRSRCKGVFDGVPNLGKPLYREKTVYIKPLKRP